MARDNETAPTGQRFLYWLAESARQARESSGESLEAIAVVSGLTKESVKRFETARHWPQNPERLLAAYAYIAGIADTRDLFHHALDLWDEFGEPPDYGTPAKPGTGGPQRPGGGFAEEIDRGVRRDLRRGGREHDETTTPARKRRAGN